jgi:hypothetical protein
MEEMPIDMPGLKPAGSLAQMMDNVNNQVLEELKQQEEALDAVAG